jgi:hypothetical protein
MLAGKVRLGVAVYALPHGGVLHTREVLVYRNLEPPDEAAGHHPLVDGGTQRGGLPIATFSGLRAKAQPETCL